MSNVLISKKSRTQPCPHCNKGNCQPARVHGTSTEYDCPKCGKKHTRRTDSDDTFLFFPGDIEAAASPEAGDPWF